MWCQTAPSDRLVLTYTLWLFLCFIEHTAAPSLCRWMVWPAFGFPATPNAHPTPLPPPIELIHDIGGGQKKVSQNPAVLARQL